MKLHVIDIDIFININISFNFNIDIDIVIVIDIDINLAIGIVLDEKSRQFQIVFDSLKNFSSFSVQLNQRHRLVMESAYGRPKHIELVLTDEKFASLNG
jgi:hypothetical protein